MSVNFGLLRPTDIGAQISAGAQDVRNVMLQREQQAQAREMQRQQIEGLAEQRRASAADRQSMVEQRQQAAAASQQRQEWLTGFASKLAEGGHKLDRPTMSQMIASPIPEIQQLGLKGLQELDAEEKFRAAMGGGAPGGAFDTQAVQGQINALLALRDPRAQAAAGQLQRQVEAEERRVNNLRDDTRQTARDAQMAADREEARKLRLTLAANRGGGGGAGGGATPATDVSSMTDDQILKLVGKGVIEVPVQGGGSRTVSRVQAVREGLMSVKQGNIDQTRATATNKVSEGRQMVSSVIENLRANYDELDRLRAIPSQDRGAVSNVLTSLEASTPGQIASRFVTTPAQTSRDVISSSRIQLLNSIKQATGMSAQQLNSNVELQTWLNAVTDPRQSKQTADQILTNIQNWVARNAAPMGGSAAPPPAPLGARPPAPAAPPLPDGFQELK
jgi:hypothetical protein